MGRVAELVDRHHGLDPITAIDEQPRVAREGRDVAGNCDDDRHLACGKLERLRLRALTRRIEHHGVEIA